ncbi:hypothetical protein K1T71_000349 [Dendrolimus kikuchii]|uniref:Uncharacterized protein n=1 Tax=Dendrolimus kikuchii TaxID=765133 RepID=A0ACC1DJ46_9NEOP|nr:hypothetical protein K1T71_000349 [Dendrolimus kikuchii]
MENKSIDRFYQNVRGWRSKLNAFYNNIESSGADLFAITETGCNPSIPDAEIAPPSYHILRCDRMDGRKQGGALLVATHRLELRAVSLPSNFNVDEYLLCDTITVSESDEALVPVDNHHPPLAITITRIGGCLASTHDCSLTGEEVTGSFAPQGINSNNNKWPQWNFRKANFNLLYSLISSVDWTPLYSIKDPAEALLFFYNTFYSLLDDCVPRKKRTCVNSRYSYPEWYTRDVIRNIRQKARFHKQYKLTKSQNDCAAFAQCRTRVKVMIATAYDRYKQRIEMCKITKDGNIIPEADCARELAHFFHSVYGTQKAKLNVDDAVAAGGGSSMRVHVDRLQLSQVSKALARLKPKHSAGPDGIPAFIMKDCQAILTEPLLHLFNLFIDFSFFPECWKVTRVVPVPKGDAGSDITNFRPVAILSAPAKIFESIIHKCILDQVTCQLSEAQHGFRPGRSTNSNLLNFMSYVIPLVDAGVQVDAPYFNFKKAFDLVDNDILLTKLAAVGCTPKLLNFFANYMRDRQQFVDYAGFKSEPYYTRSGIKNYFFTGPNTSIALEMIYLGLKKII